MNLYCRQKIDNSHFACRKSKIWVCCTISENLKKILEDEQETLQLIERSVTNPTLATCFQLCTICTQGQKRWVLIKCHIHLIFSSHAQGNIFPFFNCFHSKCDWKPWITLGAIRGYKREYKWRRCSFLEIHSCTNYNYTGQTHVLLDEIPCIIRHIFIIENRHVVETRDCLFIR